MGWAATAGAAAAAVMHQTDVQKQRLLKHFIHTLDVKVSNRFRHSTTERRSSAAESSSSDGKTSDGAKNMKDEFFTFVTFDTSDPIYKE